MEPQASMRPRANGKGGLSPAKQGLQTRNINIPIQPGSVRQSERTSIRLEPELWAFIREIQDELGITRDEFCRRAVQANPTASSVTSAVRTAVTQYYRSEALRLRADRAGAAAPDGFRRSGT